MSKFVDDMLKAAEDEDLKPFLSDFTETLTLRHIV